MKFKDSIKMLKNNKEAGMTGIPVKFTKAVVIYCINGPIDYLSFILSRTIYHLVSTSCKGLVASFSTLLAYKVKTLTCSLLELQYADNYDVALDEDHL